MVKGALYKQVLGTKLICMVTSGFSSGINFENLMLSKNQRKSIKFHMCSSQYNHCMILPTEASNMAADCGIRYGSLSDPKDISTVIFNFVFVEDLCHF